MAKIDIIKSKITLFQIFMVLVFGANASLIGWIAQNENSSKAPLAVLSVIMFSFLFVFLVKTIFKKIETLGDL